MSLIERDEKVFLRIEYDDYNVIARELEKRGLEKYYTVSLFGKYEGYVYRYLKRSERIDSVFPEHNVNIKIGKNETFTILIIDDINRPAIFYDLDYNLVVNMAVFRVIPNLENGKYIAEIPIEIEYIPFTKRLLTEIIKLYRRYLSVFYPIKKVKMNIEFY
ncbi:MAG: hypothetical protein QXL96_11490 [Ignisphaera sp.]